MGTQKCNPCFGAESPLRSTGLQTTGFHSSPYMTVRVNLRKLGATFHRGTMFAPMQSIYEKEATGMGTQKCNPCFGAESPLRSTGLQTTGFHASPYRAVSVNLRKLGATFHRGTVFAPMQSIYMKRKLPERRTQKCKPCFGAESPLRSTGLQTTSFHASPYRAVSVNLRKLGATFHCGTVFAPMQSIYMKRKLPERRTQKCKPCFGAESPLRSTGLQTTGFHSGFVTFTTPDAPHVI